MNTGAQFNSLSQHDLESRQAEDIASKLSHLQLSPVGSASSQGESGLLKRRYQDVSLDSSMDCLYLQLPRGSKAPQKPVSKTKECEGFLKRNQAVPQSKNQTFMIDTSSVLGETRVSSGDQPTNSPKGHRSRVLNFTMDDYGLEDSDGDKDESDFIR